jgi:uncharacterized membrane protein (DUF485 family)
MFSHICFEVMYIRHYFSSLLLLAYHIDLLDHKLCTCVLTIIFVMKIGHLV